MHRARIGSSAFIAAVALGLAALSPSQSSAQTILKFSHTDQPGGSRHKYGADVDAILADAEAVRKALPAR